MRARDCASQRAPGSVRLVHRRWAAAPRAPSASGEHRGRPYLLWLPDAPPPWPGMVIVHGAGSRKENHADFTRASAAAGWAALAYDQRGHGDSADEMSPEVVADAARMARLLAATDGVDAGRVCARGSSMGRFVAIHAAAGSAAIAGVVAICPAGEHHLRRGLDAGELEMRIGERGRADLRAWLAEHDLRAAVELLGARPLLLIHARGDERIPSAWSEELYAHAARPRKLIVLPGGDHRSAQHDPELQGLALRWLTRNLSPGG
ncbi:MAG: prolyl oligopeptidase family serine peptidase [Solirubrobacterales bacterium]|nr:prolyl oligopeptidase family serine peptidase [Solirubrobacterales bacterium]